MNKRISKKETGITLIALVVTIIVLLILAGISISMVAGNNGIITKAVDSKEEIRGATVKEYVDLWKTSNEADKYTSDSNSQSKNDLLDDLESQRLLINDERNRLEAGETITIGSKQISLFTNESLDLDILKNALEKRKIYDLVDENELFDALDSSKTINISLINDEAVICIGAIRDDLVIKYNDSNYKLIINWNDEDNPVIDEILNLTLVDEIITLGEFNNGDDYSAIFKYNNKYYTISANDNGEMNIINIQDDITSLKILVNSGEDGNVVLPIDNSSNSTIDWGDGNTSVIASKSIRIASLNDIKIAGYKPNAYDGHTYSEKNKEYTVTISGNLDTLDTSLDGVTSEKIIEIISWGETGLGYIYLGNCINLRKIAYPSKNSFNSMYHFDSSFWGCINLRGYVPMLWNLNDFLNRPMSGNSCFSGCTLVDNYNDIPDSWK